MTKPTGGPKAKVLEHRADEVPDAADQGLKPSTRSDIDSFIVMDVMSAAAAKEADGQRIIHMEVGQPGTPAPQSARDAVSAALADDHLGYSLALGEEKLRKRIAEHYGEMYGVDMDPNRVVVTAGSSGAFVLAFTALFNAGERVGLPSPGYPCYRQILKSLDLQPALIRTSESDRWMPTGDAVEARHADDALSGLLVASPANPTGTMLEPDRLQDLTQVSEELGLWFISDEIYHGLTYDQPAVTALSYSDEAIVINSFSKYFSMTGWRVGWMVVPERLVRVFERLAQNLFICAPAVSQVAALGAFDAKEELEANKQIYAANRELLLSELPKAGFTKIVPADGAFYLYCDISDLVDEGSTSIDLAAEILDEAGVAVTPGLDFDPERGGQFLRFSYARSTADMEQAAKQLIEWHDRRGRLT